MILLYGSLHAAQQWGEHYAQVLEAGGFFRGAASPCGSFDAHTESPQSRTVSFLCRTLTLRQWGIEYEPDQQHVSRALKALKQTDARSVATPGNDDAGGPKASELSELRRTAKWRHPPEESDEEDDLLTGELKLFQSVAARFNILAMDRSDFLYSVRELMRKMASPRTQDRTALKRVARYTIKYPRMACRYPGPRWTAISKCSVTQTLLDATPRGSPLWEVLQCGVANS